MLLSKWLKIGILLVLCMLWNTWVRAPVEAAPVAVSVCGEATIGAGEEDKAICNAQYKAVQKVLHHVLEFNKTANDPCPQILQNYNQYIIGKIQILQHKADAQTYYVIGKVVVDMDRLQQTVRAEVKAEKNATIDNTVFFFIRTVGLQDSLGTRTAQHHVQQIYNEAFQKLGFDTGDEDNTFQELSKYETLPYADFEQAIEKDLQENNVEVLTAIIGEIVITPTTTDAFGATDESHMHIKAIDLVRKNVISEFNDAYVLRRAQKEGPNGTDIFILDKSALNSSRTLAAEALRYWQQNHT